MEHTSHELLLGRKPTESRIQESDIEQKDAERVQMKELSELLQVEVQAMEQA